MQRKRSFELAITFKTKFFNSFRGIFTVPYFEKLLRKLLLNHRVWFILKLVPPNYLYNKGSLRYTSIAGINYKLDISNVVDHYIYFGFQDSDYSSVLNIIANASVILDIGANMGASSLYFGSLNPNCKIFAFEPHAENFKRAQDNIGLNSFQNIHLANIALGAKPETLKLFDVVPKNPGMNRILGKGGDEFPFQIIKVDKLDNFLTAMGVCRVDFIKIDVEGFELNVLKGGETCIKSQRPVLFLELDDDNLQENGGSAVEVIDLLNTFGYDNIRRASDLTPLSISSDLKHRHFDIIASTR